MTEKRLEAGDIVSPQTRLFSVAETSTLVSRVMVSELEVPLLQPGATVDVTVDALGGARVPGRIRRVFPSADSITRLVPVEVALTGSALNQLRPGYTIRSTFRLGSRNDALLIPTRAVMGPAGARTVVIVRQGKSERRIVRVGPDIDGTTEVLEGLAVGDTVIVAGQALLRDGSTVRIVPPLSPTAETAPPNARIAGGGGNAGLSHAGEDIRMKTRNRRGGLSSWAINRPIGTVMLTSTLLVLGLVYVGRIPVDMLPRIVYPNVNVRVGNPGVEPAVLEETIAKPLESALASTENLEKISTDISEGIVNVRLEFKYGTNVDFAVQDAAKNVERVRARLPEEADPPVTTKDDPTQQAIFSVAFSSEQRDQVALREWVDQRLRPQLLSVPGVAALDLKGGLDSRDPGRARADAACAATGCRCRRS